MLHLREVAERVEFWLFATRLESSLLMYELARRHFPETYCDVLRFRQPAYVKLLLSNRFPRTMVTTRLSGSGAIHFGPFRTRGAAEQFEAGCLDFYQLRRCQEDLQPSPDHPGCVYGEMNKCLRPCQQVVSEQEYHSESERVGAFLRTSGQSLIESIGAARDRLSEAMEFEEASRSHKRLERAKTLVDSRDGLATEIGSMNGIAVAPTVHLHIIGLWFFIEGAWRGGVPLSLQVEEGKPESLDAKLKSVFSGLSWKVKPSLRERQEHLAILAAWFYSSWREGEWIQFSEAEAPPYRRLVNAIHRVAKARTTIR